VRQQGALQIPYAARRRAQIVLIGIVPVIPVALEAWFHGSAIAMRPVHPRLLGDLIAGEVDKRRNDAGRYQRAAGDEVFVNGAQITVAHLEDRASVYGDGIGIASVLGEIGEIAVHDSDVASGIVDGLEYIARAGTAKRGLHDLQVVGPDVQIEAVAELD